jgi:hypothetical protein
VEPKNGKIYLQSQINVKGLGFFSRAFKVFIAIKIFFFLNIVKA